MSQTRQVAILIFDNVEVLDFCGPFEVFSVAASLGDPPPFNVFTVAETPDAITARNGLSVNPTYGFADCPHADLLLIPGGQGTRSLLKRESVLSWICDGAQEAELTLSVCTGALLLGKLGLLDGLNATTHHGALGLLREIAPRATVLSDERVVDNGDIVLSGGISAGIDMSLHVVARLMGGELALKTARHMEYDWEPRG